MIGVAAFAALALAAGFGWREVEEDEDEEAEKPARRKKKAAVAEAEDDEEEEEAPEPRSFVSLGWLYHFGYSLKVRLALLPAMLIEFLMRILHWRRRHARRAAAPAIRRW